MASDENILGISKALGKGYLNWGGRKLWIENEQYLDRRHYGADGPLIVVAKHQAWADFFIAFALKHPLSLGMKHTWVNNRLTGPLMRAWGAYPVKKGSKNDPEAQEMNRNSMQQLKEDMYQNGTILYFLESTRREGLIGHVARQGLETAIEFQEDSGRRCAVVYAGFDFGGYLPKDKVAIPKGRDITLQIAEGHLLQNNVDLERRMALIAFGDMYPEFPFMEKAEEFLLSGRGTNTSLYSDHALPLAANA